MPADLTPSQESLVNQSATRPIYIVNLNHSGIEEMLSASGAVIFEGMNYTAGGVKVRGITGSRDAAVVLPWSAERVNEVQNGLYRGGTCKIWAIPAAPDDSVLTFTEDDAVLIMDGEIRASRFSGNEITLTVIHINNGNIFTPRNTIAEVTAFAVAPGTPIVWEGQTVQLESRLWDAFSSALNSLRAGGTSLGGGRELLLAQAKGRMPASDLRAAATPPRDRTLTVAGSDAPIPVVYGRNSVPGLITLQGSISGDLVVGVVWCIGEIEEVETVYINSAAIPGGVTQTHYTGTTTQTVNATLASAIPAFNDPMILETANGNLGLAYSVFRIPAGAIDSVPTFQAIIKGRRVFDPRDPGPFNITELVNQEARYWRILITATRTVDAFFASINEIEIRASIAGSDLTGAGTASASSDAGASFDAAKSFDNNTSTFWASASGAGSPQWIAYDFGSIASVRQITMRSGDSTRAPRMPRTFQIQKSDDGSTWETISTYTDEAAWPINTTRAYLVDQAENIIGTTDLQYSDNTALCFADLASNPVFGLGRVVSGVAESADWNDALVEGEPRARIAIAFTQVRRTEEWLELLATYGEFLYYNEGSDIQMVPDNIIGFANPSGQNVVVNGDFSGAGGWIVGSGWNISGGEAYVVDPILPPGENVLINGDFSDNTGWTLTEGWSITGGLSYAVDSAGVMSQTVAVLNGQSSAFSFDLDDVYAGSVSVNLSGVEIISAKSVAGSYSADFTATEDNPLLEFIPSADFNGSIDNAYIYKPIALSQFLDLREGDSGVLSIELVSADTGSVSVKISGVEVIDAKSVAGTYTANVTATEDNPLLEIIPSADFNGDIDNVSLTRVFYLETNCIQGSLSVEGIDDGDSPTKVNVRYTIPSSSSGIWSEGLTSSTLPGVSTGDTRLIETTLSLPGVYRIQEATNKAQARLQRMRNRVRVTWDTTDKGLRHRIGDVVEHNMSHRGTNILVKLTSVDLIGYGRYRVSGLRYDEAHYPDEIPLPDDVGLVPVGAIVPLSGSTVPDGWADYTDADGKYILGAGGAYAIGDTGGTLTASGWTSSTDVKDMHASGGGVSSFLVQQAGTVTPNDIAQWGGNNFPNTDHSHSFTIGTLTPNLLRRENRLVIKTGSSSTNFPAAVQVMGLPGLLLAGLSRVTSFTNRLLVAQAANANAGASAISVSGTTGSAGVNHDHRVFAASRIVDLGLTAEIFAYIDAVGAHTHTYNLTLNRSPKRKSVALYGSAGDFAVIPGMIVMWSGDIGTLPSDWVLCDGGGATPDLRDFFIEIAPEGGENVSSGNNTLTVNAGTGSHAHQHKGSSSFLGTPTFAAIHDDSGLHNHTISETRDWMPPYYALAAIMYSP